MEIKKQSVGFAGACNFCNEGKIGESETYEYPYAHVYVIKGNGLEIRACPKCLHDLVLEAKIMLKVNENNDEYRRNL